MSLPPKYNIASLHELLLVKIIVFWNPNWMFKWAWVNTILLQGCAYFSEVGMVIVPCNFSVYHREAYAGISPQSLPIIYIQGKKDIESCNQIKE